MKIRNLAIVGGLMVAAGAATIACSGDDDDTSAPKTDSGTGTTIKTDSGTGGTGTGTTTDAGSAPSHAAVSAFVGLVISQQIETNPVLLSYFKPNATAPGGQTNGVNNKPSLADIQDCLATQFGQVLGNGDTYVLADGGGASTPSHYVCRPSMSAIHQPLFIPYPVFEEFLNAILAEGAVQMPPLMLTSQQTLAITGQQPMIVYPNSPDAALSFGWENEGGMDAGDSGTTDAGDGGDGGDAH